MSIESIADNFDENVRSVCLWKIRENMSSFSRPLISGQDREFRQIYV
jgi:hypothetical protein